MLIFKIEKLEVGEILTHWLRALVALSKGLTLEQDIWQAAQNHI